MDPVTMQWVTLAAAAGSYLLHAWQAYRASPQPVSGNPQPGNPMPVVPNDGRLHIGHGELISLLGGFASSLLGGVSPVPVQPVPAQPSPVVPVAQPVAQVDLNQLLTGLMALIQQSQPKPVVPH